MFELTSSPIQIEIVSKKLKNPKAGAYVAFEGWVRNHHEGKGVLYLEYEAYGALCSKEAEKILKEAQQNFQIYDIFCVHRTGKCDIGDLAVWIGVSAAHRGPAFSACEYFIDQLKIRVPIWKKETYADGMAEWVECQGCKKHLH